MSQNNKGGQILCGISRGIGGVATNKENEAKGPKPAGSFSKIASELLSCQKKLTIHIKNQPTKPKEKNENTKAKKHKIHEADHSTYYNSHTHILHQL
jgi:hypothetical protein